MRVAEGLFQHLAVQTKSKMGLSSPQVSFVAHFGGIAAGMTVGYVFFSAYNMKLLKDPRFWLCIAGYTTFVVFAVLFNIFLSPAP